MRPARCGSCDADQGWMDDGHLPPSYRCSQCPPTLCAECGEMDHNDALCSCWRETADIPMADLKGLFAGVGMSLDIGLKTGGAS